MENNSTNANGLYHNRIRRTFAGRRKRQTSVKNPIVDADTQKKKPQIPVDTPGRYSFPDQYTMVAAIRMRYMATINSTERTANLRMRLANSVRNIFIEEA